VLKELAFTGLAICDLSVAFFPHLLANCTPPKTTTTQNKANKQTTTKTKQNNKQKKNKRKQTTIIKKNSSEQNNQSLWVKTDWVNSTDHTFSLAAIRHQQFIPQIEKQPVTKLIAIHMHFEFLHWPVHKTESFWCNSVSPDTLVTSKWSAGKERKSR